MILPLILLACNVPLDDAQHEAAVWVGPSGRVLGCSIATRNFGVASYSCDVEDNTHVRTNLRCDPSCTEWKK